jgi:hypothetical protein
MNCASRIETMSLWEYEALLYWNDESDDLEAPDPKVAIPLLERINADVRLTH